jgi:hypothetical protein
MTRGKKNKNVVCGHLDVSHWSLGMCRRCYDKYRYANGLIPTNGKKQATCHPERKMYAKGLCESCYRREYSRKHGKDYDRLTWEKVKDKLGHSCRCCGDTHQEFLTLEHKKGGGRAHYRSRSGWKGVMSDVLKDPNSFDKYEILCFNCNCSRNRVGYCPHEQEGDKSKG